ncbi:MAG: hypothetical protein J6386_07365 [Candidatus Synoicihabitans palmerolidicus]|nr:hypothetical protein [Candidatus Synoicihabitans palmerolidicus]
MAAPLYINGKFAGALSYQVQRFETVRFAGFTSAADLYEVRRIAMDLNTRPGALPASGLSPSTMGRSTAPIPRHRNQYPDTLEPLSLVFALGGISPNVAAWLAEPLAELGLNTTALGGAMSPSALSANDLEGRILSPGQAVGAALAIGDIALAGTGTISSVDGNRVLAFGHPLLGLGTVEVPMTAAEIVAILPSNLSSFKIANTGAVICTVRQDRLSAIYGELGSDPPMVAGKVHTPQRTLNFSTVRHPRLTPMIMATGLSQAVLGSNDAGLSEGFALRVDVDFPGGESLRMSRLYAGPQGFKVGLEGLV